MQLSLDAWDGPRVSFRRTDNPTVQQVLDAVDQLDGEIHTEVSLTRDEPWEQLTIGGGPEYFLVSGEGRDESFPHLTNPDAPEGKIELVCGGQSAEFELHEVVSREMVTGAVEQFFAGLSADLPAPWVIQ